MRLRKVFEGLICKILNVITSQYFLALLFQVQRQVGKFINCAPNVKRLIKFCAPRLKSMWAPKLHWKGGSYNFFDNVIKMPVFHARCAPTFLRLRTEVLKCAPKKIFGAQYELSNLGFRFHILNSTTYIPTNLNNKICKSK